MWLTVNSRSIYPSSILLFRPSHLIKLWRFSEWQKERRRKQIYKERKRERCLERETDSLRERPG